MTLAAPSSPDHDPLPPPTATATATPVAPSVTVTATAAETAHDEVTLQLAKIEKEHHYHGMEELQSIMQTKPLKIKAYSLEDESAPSLQVGGEIIVKIVHFVRHGQGFHNLFADIYKNEGKEWTQFKNEENNPYVKMELLDAPLTDKGRKQAQILRPRIDAFGTNKKNSSNGINSNNDNNENEKGTTSDVLDEEQTLEMVVLSTNCRALQTGVIAFQSYIGKVPFIAHEMIREEIGVHLCDQRRPISSQKLEFPMVNFDLVESDEDDLFSYEERESKAGVGERIYKFMEWLELREETHVGVTSHSGWLFALFNGVVECDENLKAWFQTGEMRSVKLVFSRTSPPTCTENE
eukprot:CAMPEP_0203680348 /NCGR_PEP_ID=MMETSP0090-20130426/38889_1 /ASSEMBLY_ACC=CAM_ASM_001088 /TAXON_ID=426623 /ORGANISM="Chaetoceros affinis, Strain CCMP159" /LENGTH=349 /DNA_ID=CAMNT_0050548369 /DNA_START=145 /DNA_END=1194 /DNA_ORIENTATION=-